MSGFDEVRPRSGRSPDPRSPRLSPAQFALIRACVADDRDVAAAADEWLASVDIDQLDETALELTGFLYRRLVDLDVDHIARAKLAWSYRRTWHRNQMLVFRARPLLARIGEVTGRTLVLKGGAMISSAYHDDLGVRSLMDLDVLVGRHYVEPLVDWALEHGWHIVKGFDPEDVYIVHHAIDLAYGNEGAVDLHWGLLVQGRNPSRDRELLAKSRPARLGDVPIHVLSPTAQLFHTASHAKPMGVRHVVDAISIIVHDGDEIDWSELVDEVIERRSIAYTVRTFDLVEQVRPGTIPGEALGRLSRASRPGDVLAPGSRPAGRRRGRGALPRFRSDREGSRCQGDGTALPPQRGAERPGRLVGFPDPGRPGTEPTRP